MTLPILNTEHLILRPYHKNDAARLVELLADYDVVKMTLNIPHPYTPEEAEIFLNDLPTPEEHNTYIWAITLNDDLIGGISLRVNHHHRNAESGYWIGKAYWGKGYAGEALKTVIKYGFEAIQLNKIFATVFTHNPASTRVTEKAGMRYEGCLRKHVQRDDVFYDIYLYGILKEDEQA